MTGHRPGRDHGSMDPTPSPYAIRIRGHLLSAPARTSPLTSIFAASAVIGGALLRLGPLAKSAPLAPAHDRITTAQAGPSREQDQ